MKKLKNIVKDDFENKLEKDLSFDVNKLESNPKKRSFKWLIVLSCLAPCFIILAFFASQILNVNESFSRNNKKYSLSEIKMIEQSTFKKINKNNYPSSSYKNNKNSEAYIKAIHNFTNKIYHNVLDKGDNFAFSPMGLYSNLNILSYASNSASEELDNLLGLTKDKREEEFKKMVDNNYFANNDGVVELSNAVFFTNQLAYNEVYVDRLTENFVEAYQMDFLNDKEYLFSWINQKLHEKNFVDDEELTIDKDTALYILSCLYFDNRWKHSFSTSNTKKGIFYLANKNVVNVEFMQTTYFGDIYDYGKFISVSNYYHNGYNIEYFVPKNLEDSIYNIIDGFDLFEKTNVKEIKNGAIEINVPKFSSSYSYDFKDTLENVGLVKSFSILEKPFNNAFKNLDENTSIYLKEVKQKSKISFNESGTTIKSLSIATAKNTSVSDKFDHYTINLNQPYIYIIYDSNNLPIYLGNVDNPA